MFISLSSTCIQNFSNGHTLFIFLLHSVAFVAWSGIQRVDPQMIHFALFCHPVRGSQFNSQTIFVQYRQLKKYILGIHPEKIIIPALPQQGFCISLQIGDELGVTWQTKQRGFFAISGASNFKHSLFTTLSGHGLLTI